MAMTKSDKIRRYWGQHPDASPATVMNKFDASSAVVYTLRKQVKNNEVEVLEPRARKTGPNNKLVKDIETIQSIGVDRVRKILDLLCQ